jgi:trehalose/maltose hydrolase-like predicted phosphorylase
MGHDALWRLHYEGFKPDEERLREALTTVGNGYFGTRGSLESEPIDDDLHYPGTYVAGLYNRGETEIHDRTISNSDFVNCPNWTSVTVHIDGGQRLSPHTCDVLDFEHWTDLRQAVTHRTLTLRDGEGRETRISSERFASMERTHLAAMRLVVEPLNYTGTLTIRSSLDGEVRNYLVERYRDLEQHHLEPVRAEQRDDGVFLAMRTTDGGDAVCMRARVCIDAGEAGGEPERSVDLEDARATDVFTVQAEAESTVALEKLVTIYTSVDYDCDDPPRDVEALIADAGAYDEERRLHVERWDDLWYHADVEVEDDAFAQRVLRLHAYHLLSTASPHNVELDVGLPARGLHGEAYRGHIFWDELFITPFFTLRFPEIAKSHLMYRYRRLEGARKLAREAGYQGAMYPWQSADTGGPESQDLHYNPKSGEWDPDLSHLQRHVSISIAYDVYTFFYATGDEQFLHDHGMELLIEIARFWASIAEYDDRDGRYHICGVMGPDEFHEKYPDAPLDEGGFRDNAYTNVMAAWLLHKTAETFQHRPAGVKRRLEEQIGFDGAEAERWESIVRGLTVVMDDDGLISQFDGYRDLEELDWDAYREKYDSIRRMDRILKAEGDSPDRYKVAKQADALMMFYLLAPGQVTHMLDLMGYEAPGGAELLRRNYEYYEPRTSHGSTLSWIVHAAILRYLNEHGDDQWRWFVECLKSDIHDTQGGTTLEGIHCGVMAGSIDIVVTAFAGLNLYRDRLEIEPRLPAKWKRIAFRIIHQGEEISIEVRCEDGESVAYVTRETTAGKALVAVGRDGVEHKLPVGEQVRLPGRMRCGQASG